MIKSVSALSQREQTVSRATSGKRSQPSPHAHRERVGKSRPLARKAESPLAFNQSGACPRETRQLPPFGWTGRTARENGSLGREPPRARPRPSVEAAALRRTSSARRCTASCQPEREKHRSGWRTPRYCSGSVSAPLAPRGRGAVPSEETRRVKVAVHKLGARCWHLLADGRRCCFVLAAFL